MGTAALTTQFRLPFPAKYYRNFYTRLRKIWDFFPCWQQMRGIASAGGKLKDAQKWFETVDANEDGVLTREEVSKQGLRFDSADFVAFYDLNDDGHVSAEELTETFRRWSATEQK